MRYVFQPARNYGKTHCYKIWEDNWKDQMTFQDFYRLWIMSQVKGKD